MCYTHNGDISNIWNNNNVYRQAINLKTNLKGLTQLQLIPSFVYIE